MCLLLQWMSKSMVRRQFLSDWDQQHQSGRLQSKILSSQLILILLTETVSHREELPRTLLVHFPNIGFLAKRQNKNKWQKPQVLQNTSRNHSNHLDSYFHVSWWRQNKTARQHLNQQLRRQTSWKNMAFSNNTLHFLQAVVFSDIFKVQFESLINSPPFHHLHTQLCASWSEEQGRTEFLGMAAV